MWSLARLAGSTKPANSQTRFSIATRTDGLLTTLDAVQSKLDQPLPLGYCNVGTVAAVGPGVGFKKGDRVASNGSHAELVAVPQHLCADPC